MATRTRSCLASVIILASLLVGSVQCDYRATYFYSSCTGLQSALPNLSYAKAATIGPVTWSCNDAGNYPYSTSLTWYYYTNYPPTGGCVSPPPGNECCHSIATSTISYTSSTFVNTPTSVIETSIGTVSAGPFQGLSATLVATTEAATAACLNQTGPGVEARSGPIVLTISGLFPLTLLTCNGVVTLEMCPGIHTST